MAQGPGQSVASEHPGVNQSRTAMIYWDTSALFWRIVERDIAAIQGVTRTHALAELFSALTGGGWREELPGGVQRQRRMGTVLAQKSIADLRGRLDFVDLSADEVISALADAKRLRVQGGRVHDLLHMRAAEKARATEFWTVDEHDFERLGSVAVKLV